MPLNTLFIILVTVCCGFGSAWAANEPETATANEETATDTSAAASSAAPERVSPNKPSERAQDVSRFLSQHQREHELTTLNTNGEEFLGLWLPQRTRTPQGAALILPGDQEHGQWPLNVAPLRENLPDYGWSTLAIALPDIPVQYLARTGPATETPTEPQPDPQSAAKTNSETEQYSAQMLKRIDAAVNYLQNQGQLNLVIIANGHNAHWAAQWFAQKNIGANNEKGMALALIDAQDDAYAPQSLLQLLPSFSFPILDLVYANTPNQALLQRQRAGAMRQAKRDDYQQLSLSAWNDEALRRIRGWLKTKLAGDERRVKETPSP